MWKPIHGFEGRYEVSDDGQVRSMDTIQHRKDGKTYHTRGRLMKQTITIGRGTAENPSGYSVVNLRKPGYTRVFPVHLLVAKAFIPNELCLPTVNHIDGNKQNNCVSNLEWASYSDNNTHALRSHLRAPRGTPVSQYTVSGEYVATYNSTCEASRQTGITHMNIFQCLHGRTKTAGGYVWKHVSEGATTIPEGSTPEIDAGGSASRPHKG